MEQNKLEQEFKKKLAERTIQPSAQAWDRLDAMLTVTEDKKPRKKRTWLYIAASFLAFLMIGAFLLQQEKNTNNNGTIITNDAVVNTTEAATEPKTQQPEEKDVPAVDAESTPYKAIQKEAAVAQTTTGKEKKVKNTTPVYNTNENQTENQEKLITPITEYKETTVAATQNVEEEVKTPKRGITVNPDVLLASVEKKDVKSSIASSVKNSNSKIKVDSNALLSSAEGEVNESFRNKVLNSVVKNYNTVKTAVANRNYQQNQ